MKLVAYCNFLRPLAARYRASARRLRNTALKHRYTFPEGMESNLRRQKSSEDYSFRQQVAEEDEWE